MGSKNRREAQAWVPRLRGERPASMLGRALHLGLLLCAYHLGTHHLTFKFVFCEICLDREALRCGPTSPGQAPGCLLHTQGPLQGVHRCRENQVDAGALGHLRAGPGWGWRAQGEERCPVFLQLSGEGQLPSPRALLHHWPGPRAPRECSLLDPLLGASISPPNLPKSG